MYFKIRQFNNSFFQQLMDKRKSNCYTIEVISIDQPNHLSSNELFYRTNFQEKILFACCEILGE
jgi:hypothetical protein